MILNCLCNLRTAMTYPLYLSCRILFFLSKGRPMCFFAAQIASFLCGDDVTFSLTSISALCKRTTPSFAHFCVCWKKICIKKYFVVFTIAWLLKYGAREIYHFRSKKKKLCRNITINLKWRNNIGSKIRMSGLSGQ